MAKARILIAEGDGVAPDLKGRLKRMGYMVVAVVPTAERAVAECDALKPDLVLIDLLLGGGVEAGRYVLLAVSDTGTGMEAETRQRVFEPFFTTKEIGKGTGMGLATVYGIIKQSKGSIWVYSEPGQGTTFKIYLPRVDKEAEHIEAEELDAELPGGTERVLLVEDEELFRNLTRQILEMCGYTILEAENGSQALRLCEAEGCVVDLLSTDVIMPQMGGRELVARLAPTRPDLRVLYMSGYTDSAIVHHGVLATGTNFIQKPFSPDTLAHKVREVLDAPG